MRKDGREPLKFRLVRTQQEWESIKGELCGHKIDDHSLTPILLVLRGNRIVAFFQIITSPILIPNFDPDPSVCSPRDFKEITEHVIAWQHISTQNSVADPHSRCPYGQAWFAFDEEPVIGREVCEKMGLERTHASLWRATPK